MLNTGAIINAVVSHALTTGLFESVNGHEPKSAPGNGLTVAVWRDRVGPVPEESGLKSTSARLILNVRVYQNMLSEPQDAIDPRMADATDELIGAYSAGFTLGGLVKCVDLLGMAGIALDAQAGYLNQDGKLFRVDTITLPMIVNDVWDQVP